LSRLKRQFSIVTCCTCIKCFHSPTGNFKIRKKKKKKREIMSNNMYDYSLFDAYFHCHNFVKVISY
uniref:Ovule protein n=1 Tax=Brugia timori TaxID=42155 RepID=A0A0R3R457_9BILA